MGRALAWELGRRGITDTDMAPPDLAELAWT